MQLSPFKVYIPTISLKIGTVPNILREDAYYSFGIYK